MTTHHSWLDDVRPNPYADQLAMGFRGLRFARPLESQYRLYLQEDSFDLKRIALSVGVLVWLAFAGLDLVLIPSLERWWMLSIRLGVLLLLLACGMLMLIRRHTHLLVPLSLTCIVAPGLGAAAVVAVAHTVDQTYPYEGLLLICMAAYFLAGLRLSEALASSLVVLLGYVGFELLSGLPVTRLINNVLFLIFGNVMGLVGGYLLEYKAREHFLISRLMRVLADRDSLTSLHNRRSFNRQLERLWRQAQREHRNLALLLCDIDHFKAYNDCYGHQAGDNVLRRTGGVFSEAARRPLDMAVRLGGEEFAVLLYDLSMEQALQRAEELRLALAELNIRHEGSSTAEMVTMSIGVACMRPADGGEFSQLYECADRALYRAKALGRNQVV
ncbi:GGDEF domain-containing protein [Pseudomonas sp. LS44]|uniref:GGDEF domain-containing protein n=1 Tax=Pseudomonas sp. LS44 TaxID=1357074 RepID=UPI00215B0C42|nr:GGDEF domain-containing protein [Pseudomonas sp. LS44]UVE18989.1 GGDEF domain-containing protein [Pseudomonas sp. LS44]